MSCNRPTELAPAGHLRLTREAQILLVAEAMAQVRPEGEKATTGVLGGVEAYTSVTQKAWYRKELNKALRAGRKALAAAEAAAVVVEEPEAPSVAEALAVEMDVLAEPVRYQQIEQQQAQAAAPVLAAYEPECDRCGALLDDLGSCPRCTPLRLSAPTHDLAGLLRGDGWGEERRELVTETADGKITLRAVPGGVRLEVERAGGAVAAVVLETGARLDLVTDLMQLGRAEAWGGQ